MIGLAKRLSRAVLTHRYGATLFSYLAAACATGVGCVLFMRGFDAVLERRIDFQGMGAWPWVTTPALFLAAVWLIRRFGPCAAGTGIPQAIFAAKHMDSETEKALRPLLSLRTMTIKIAALLLGLLAGASTGREGPTVHVAACIFMGVMLLFRRLTGLAVDLRSVVIAGGAAGLAAAFNTPLAGVTFAIEELTPGHFGGLKDFVLVAIITAALAAKALTGEYSYFGRLAAVPHTPLAAVALIGLVGGLAGALFSSAILRARQFARKWPYGAPMVLSLGLLAVASWAGTGVLGPGNQQASRLVQGDFGAAGVFFPFFKALATLLTYWSGIAGGIFAPCLSIGAGLGADVARVMSLPVAGCALVGMSAFLSGTIQAPITAFVIIFEMSGGHHEMLLPVMLGSLTAFMVARLTGSRHLYQALSEDYGFLLGKGRKEVGRPGSASSGEGKP